MRKFNITVNGKSYEVDVEEIGGAVTAPRPAAAPAPRAAAPAAAPAPAPAAPQAAPVAPAAPAAPAAAVPTGGTQVTSPMPGTILDIRVKVGDTIQYGDVLLILEAMKMENEIMSPQTGTIVAVNTTKGASVNSGELLIVIE